MRVYETKHNNSFSQHAKSITFYFSGGRTGQSIPTNTCITTSESKYWKATPIQAPTHAPASTRANIFLQVQAKTAGELYFCLTKEKNIDRDVDMHQYSKSSLA